MTLINLNMRTFYLLVFVLTYLSNNHILFAENYSQVKKSVILNNWYFQVDYYNVGEKKWFSPDYDFSAWAKVEVPKAWDCYNEGLWGYEGTGWYALTKEWPKQANIQRFGDLKCAGLSCRQLQ